jgi:hypothetical protein
LVVAVLFPSLRTSRLLLLGLGSCIYPGPAITPLLLLVLLLALALMVVIALVMMVLMGKPVVK